MECTGLSVYGSKVSGIPKIEYSLFHGTFVLIVLTSGAMMNHILNNINL